MRQWVFHRVAATCFVVGLVLFGSFGVARSAHGLFPPDQVAAILRAKGVMVGYEDGTLRWEGTVSRAEAVKILLTAIGESTPSLERSTMVFLDVNQSHWAFGHITFAAEIGLIRGRPEKIFDPDQGVTMAEFMVMASRVYAGLGSQAGTVDQQVRIEPPWAASELAGWPDLVGLVAGKASAVNLDYPASRGEVAVLVAMMMERLGLAYDLTGVVETVSTKGERLLLRADDGPASVEIPLDNDVSWYVDGISANSEFVVGRRAKVVLDALGRGAVVIVGS